MEDQFSDSSFEEANRLIHSAFNSSYAMNHAKNVAIRKQLLEAAIQKLLESKTFYISDVRDIAAMNNRVFDSRTKLYEQLNILNCREYRKMRTAVLDLLPLMIHRATGIPEQRFATIVEANRGTTTAHAETASASAATPAAASATAAAAAAAAPALSAAKTTDAEKTAEQSALSEALTKPSERGTARPWPLLLSLGLNLVLGVALLTSMQLHRQAEPVVAGSVAAPAKATPLEQFYPD